MNIFYKIAEHFSEQWQVYATAGAVTGFFLLTAYAGKYDGKEIEENKHEEIKKRRNLGDLLKKI